MDKDVNVSILGCTGSIGQNTISVINAGTKFSGVNFCALTGNNNIERLIDVALKLENLFKAFFVTFSGLIAAFISISMVLSLFVGLFNV